MSSIQDASGFEPVLGSQQVFRELLDAMARPGQPGRIQGVPTSAPAPWPPGLAAVGLTLLDQEVSFEVLGADAQPLVHYLRHATRVCQRPASEAGYIFARGTDPTLAQTLERLSRGTLEEPHRGATVILAVEALSPERSGPLRLTLKGPGIAGERQLSVQGLSAQVLEARARVNAGFPLGVDFILVDRAQRLACLPRTTHCTWEGVDSWDM